MAKTTTTKTKKRTGRGMELSLDERQRIAVMKASGMSNSAIARETRRTRQTVIDTLKHPDVEMIRQQTRNILTAGLPQMAQNWLTAAEEGAKRGRHEPARDGLLHLGVIEPIADAQPKGPQILIGIASLPGLPDFNQAQDLIASGAVTNEPNEK